MATVSDSFGLCNDLTTRAELESLYTILQEVIQNRHHGVPCDKYKFLFSTFKSNTGTPCFIYASNQYRTQESIVKEHSVFNFTERGKNDKAKIGTRGYGAKLFPFKISGFYSVWYSLENMTVFNKNLDYWAQRNEVSLHSLIKSINENKVIQESDLNRKYGGTYESCKDLQNNICVKFQLFSNSELGKFIEENNFKYFQVFLQPKEEVNDELLPALEKLAKLLETNEDVELWYSNNLDIPKKVSVEDGNVALHLHPKYWTENVHIEWKMGQKDKSGLYYQNKLRWYDQYENVYYHGLITSNGSTDACKLKKFATRTKADTISTQEEKDNWDPDMSITIALTKPEYASTKNKQVYIFIEDDLISDETGTIGLDNSMRNLGTHQSRYRIIIRILKNDLKYDINSGLSIEDVKRKSTIRKSGAIYFMALESIKLARKYYNNVQNIDKNLENTRCFKESIKDIPRFIEMDKEHTEKSTKRKREGNEYEKNVKEYLFENLQDAQIVQDLNITCEGNDTEIGVKHELGDLAGIDTLITISKDGFEKNVRVCIQIKKRTDIRIQYIQPFIDTLNAMKNKYKEDIFYSYLVVANLKSMGGPLLHTLQDNDITCIIDDAAVSGEITLQKIIDDLFKSPFSVCGI